jgi:hypothetical protein
VDKFVQHGVVQPGQYLDLHFDFSRVINASMESLEREIDRGLSEFKLAYAEVLGESFKSETSSFVQNDPAGNLTDLVRAVHRTLEGIQKSGKEDHPLWGVKGVCLS